MPRNRLSFFLLASLTLLLAACTTPQVTAPTVKAVTIAPADALVLEPGESQALSAEVTTTGDVDDSVSWSSSDKSVATVNDEGFVTAVALGDATITATSNFDEAIQDSVAVSVIVREFAHCPAGTARYVSATNGDATATGASPLTPLDSIQAAVHAAAAGDTVCVADGDYVETLQISKSVTIAGASESGVMVQPLGAAYGVYVDASDVTLSGMTIVGGDHATGNNYGVKAEAGADGLVLEDVTVTNFGRSEIDLNGIRGAVLTRVTADGAGTAGVGVALSNVSDVTLMGVTTRGNAWGGVGLYTTPAGGVSNAYIDESSVFEEPVPVYADLEHGNEVMGLRLDGMRFAVLNQASDRFAFFVESEARAQALVDAATDVDKATTFIRPLQRDANGFVMYADEFLVADGLSIMTAINEANAGAKVTVLAGTYAEDITLSKPITLESASVGEAQISGIIRISGTDVVVDGFNVRDLVRFGGDGHAAFYLLDGAEATIRNNHVDGDGMTSSNGVIDTISGESHATIVGNTFVGLTRGAYLQGTGAFDVTNNTFTGNTVGISINLEDVTIAGNTFAGNTDEGIGLGVAGASIDGNTFEVHTNAYIVDYSGSGTYVLGDLIAQNTFPGLQVTAGTIIPSWASTSFPAIIPQ